MSDILAESNAWLEGERHLYLTQSITITRGIDSVSILATIEETDYQVEDTDGNLLDVQATDFIVRPADLGVLSLPQRGDKVSRTVNGKALVFEVWAPRGEPIFNHDTERTSIRIHTQLVNETTA